MRGSTPEEREANSFDQMLSRLSNVFERLRWAGLSMKASKCTLFATQAEYLGHVIQANRTFLLYASRLSNGC